METSPDSDFPIVDIYSEPTPPSDSAIVKQYLIAQAAVDLMRQNIAEATVAICWKRSNRVAVAFVGQHGVEVALTDDFPSGRNEIEQLKTQCIVGLAQKMGLRSKPLLRMASRAKSGVYRIYRVWQL